MLRKVRILLATVMMVIVTLLFLDFTGTAARLFSWAAKIQFMPAILATNFLVVAGLVIVTLIFGRVYCSVVCPLGITQDIVAWFGRRSKPRRYGYSPARKTLRVSFLVLFVAALIFGISSIVTILDPYSAFGKIASNILNPIYRLVNNLLAGIAAQCDCYAIYTVDFWIKSWVSLAVAVVTLAVIGILAWRNGRTYCNTVCPVGTVLGYISKYSLMHPRIDTDKCNSCGQCARNCKGACINPLTHRIDLSRCVGCMDCIDACRQGAITYTLGTKPAPKKKTTDGTSGISRRKFLSISGAMALSTAAKAQRKGVDGGLAVIEDKKVPVRSTRLVPPGALSIKHLSSKCTGCQLCVTACPNSVLRPSEKLETFLQPEMSYERGWCRPECTACTTVCPTGAIIPVSVEEKTAVRIGRARVIPDNCLSATGAERCGNCARKCPAHAITMVPSDPSDKKSPSIPVVDESKCIGCGACENLCPVRPFSAIVVDGYEVHMEK